MRTCSKPTEAAQPPSGFMKHLVTFLVLLACGSGAAHAARISEPGTTLYGRVLTRVGQAVFPITEGELKWTLVVPSQGNRHYELKTRLQPIADGAYAYKLTIPHQVLAYDLTVSGANVPLTASGWRFQHLQVLVNGRPALLLAPATDDFTASQSARAATHRIDLEVPGLSEDSDGDGVPDWYEDLHGTDKWNPNDGAPLLGGPAGGSGTDPGTFTGHTFAEWRQHYFPSATGELQAFAAEDDDGDGASNLIEYAFNLDPKRPDTTEEAARLPYPRLNGQTFGIVFTPRVNATDLEYLLESTQDLIHWTSPAEEVEQTTLEAAEAAPGQTCLSVTSPAEDAAMRFLRLRVRLK
jgi:hypothetical protein